MMYALMITWLTLSTSIAHIKLQITSNLCFAPGKKNNKRNSDYGAT